MRLACSLTLITTLALALSPARSALAQTAAEGEGGADHAEVEGEAAFTAVEPHRAPPSALAFVGARLGRLNVALGAGWPAALLELDYGATDLLGVALRVGYLYGAPYGGFRTSSALSVELGVRLRVLSRDRLILTLDVDAGLLVAFERTAALISQPLDPDAETPAYVIPSGQELRPLGSTLNLGLTLSWQVIPSLALKLGLTIPAHLLLLRLERPYEDGWELAIPFAVRAGVVYRLGDWIGLHALVDVGPALQVETTAWTSEGYEREVGAGLYFRAIAGVTFTPSR